MTTPVEVPDIGDFADIPIIEIHVGSGDTVDVDDPLITLESDKATMDVPSPAAGAITDVLVKVGDTVSQGTRIAMLQPGDGALTPPTSLVDQQEPPPAETEEVVAAAKESAAHNVEPAPGESPAGVAAQAAATGPAAPSPVSTSDPHAGPGVRRLARELGVDLASISGTGPKGRITKDDLLGVVRGPAAAPPGQATAAATATGIPEIPAQDFSKFGPIEIRPLSRIKKVSGPFLHRSWLNVPHVTQNDEADITDLDAYRKELDTAAKAEGYRVTLLAFLVKTAVSALRQFPEFNSSLSPEKDSLILKNYYNIGIAVDTPDGLVVPVVKDADRKGITELSKEFGAISARARDGKLSPSDMQGGTFTISSLGGIGGTSFTPIVNAPEVAILGVVRSKMAPVWNGSEFVPRLMLPLSLSYDHRVVDGALAARFLRHVCTVLEDVRRLLL